MISSSPRRPRSLLASLILSLTLVGCGGEGVDTTGFSAPLCESGGWLSVRGLSPEVQPDFIQLRRVLDPRVTDEAPTATGVSSLGEPCSTASHQGACGTALEGLPSDQGFHESGLPPFLYYLATTRGDTVAALTTPRAVGDFLGTIDTAQEALLMAFAQGYDVGCDRLAHGAVRANPDAQGGFRVIATRGQTCGAGTELRQYLLSVSPTGEVSELSNVLLEKGDPHCAL